MNDSINLGAPSIVTSTQKLGRFSASRRIVQESWKILKQDKEMMYFSVISMMLTLLAALGMGAIYYFVILGGSIDSIISANANHGVSGAREVGQVVKYAALFIYYIIIFFIVNFFEAGLITIAQGRIMGADLNFNDGMRGATENMGKIFIWSAINATVGVMMRIGRDKSKGFLGKFFVALSEGSWAIATYFSLPALVVGKLGVMDAFRESSALINRTWGETFLVKVQVGFYFMILFFTLMLPLLIIMIFFPSIVMAIVLVAVGGILLIGISIVSGALNSIFKLVLYNYARTGVVPAGFPPELVQSAVGQKVV